MALYHIKWGDEYFWAIAKSMHQATVKFQNHVLKIYGYRDEEPDEIQFVDSDETIIR